MKKLVTYSALIILAVLIGWWFGLKIFNNKENIEQVKHPEIQRTVVSQEKKPTPLAKRKSKKVVKKKIDEESQVKIKQALDNFIRVRVPELQAACQEALTNSFPKPDYLDPNNKVFENINVIGIGFDVLSNIGHQMYGTQEMQEAFEELKQGENVDPELLRSYSSKLVVCNDVQYLNFMNAVVQAFAKEKRFDNEYRSSMIDRMLENIQIFASNTTSFEYTFTAMEYLFALVDNEVISREYADDLTILRQDILNYSLATESDYSAAVKDKALQRELLFDYYDNQKNFNEEIIRITEKIRNDYVIEN